MNLQEQHEKVKKYEQNSVHPHQVLRYPISQNIRALSNPEQIQRSSRSRSNIEVRGEFRGDPSDRRTGATSNAFVPGIEGSTAMPPPAHPNQFGFGHQHQPYQIVPTPLASRQDAFDGSHPRGKKNPTKRMSDDARRGSNTSTSERSSLSRGPSSAWQQAQSSETLNSFSGSQMQPYFPSPRNAAPDWQPQAQGNIALDFPQGVENMTGPPHLDISARQPHHSSQPPMQGPYIRDLYPSMPEMAVGQVRYISNPYQPMPDPAMGQSDRTRDSYSSTDHIHVQNAIIVDPNDFENRLPSAQPDSIGQHKSRADPEMASLGSMPNIDQGSMQYTPENVGSVEQDHKLWIGGLPKGITHAALLPFLQQCAGVVSTTLPMTSYHRGDLYYCFAE